MRSSLYLSFVNASSRLLRLVVSLDNPAYYDVEES